MENIFFKPRFENHINDKTQEKYTLKSAPPIKQYLKILLPNIVKNLSPFNDQNSKTKIIWSKK